VSSWSKLLKCGRVTAHTCMSHILTDKWVRSHTAPETSCRWNFHPNKTLYVDLYHQLRTKYHFAFVPQWVSQGRYALVSNGRVRHLLDSKKFSVEVWIIAQQILRIWMKHISRFRSQIAHMNRNLCPHDPRRSSTDDFWIMSQIRVGYILQKSHIE